MEANLQRRHDLIGDAQQYGPRRTREIGTAQRLVVGDRLFLRVGLPVGGTEGSDATKFGAATSDELKLFQDRYHLPVTGNLDPATGGILSLSALVATEPDRTKLRTELTNMVDNVPDSPDYNYWLARYAIMAGDYTTAKNAADALADRIDLLTKLEGILDPWRQLPLQPEIRIVYAAVSYPQSMVMAVIRWRVGEERQSVGGAKRV